MLPEQQPLPGLRSVSLASNTPDEESYHDLPIELDPFEDGGNDDEEASDLVVGEEIDVLGDSAGDNEPIELDLGTLVSKDDFLTDAHDDRDSSVEIDAAIGLALPDALTPDDGSEGLDDGDITVDESKFPRLENDDGSEGIAAEREIALSNHSDEARVPEAAVPWQIRESAASLEACNALSFSADSVVAGSSDLLWFRNDSRTPLRLAVDGSTLADLVLVGPAGDIALACTQSGKLFRRARFASQAEQITRFREPLKSAPGSRVRLSFAGELGSEAGRVLLWSSDGALLEVLDAGERFERLNLDGLVVAAARESATILLARGRKCSLVFLGGTAPSCELVSAEALEVAHSRSPLLESSGHAIALAEAGRALLVSADQGKTWKRVAGSANVTAIASAGSSGRPRFFAAAYRETIDQSDILLIDAESGEAVCIARVDTWGEPSRSDPSERAEWAKVLRLVWHEASARLWAAGGFGVASFAESALT